MPVVVNALTALLVYLRIQAGSRGPTNCEEMLAEAVAVCVFSCDRLMQEENKVHLSLHVLRGVTDTTEGYLALLCLGVELLRALQRSSLAVSCALKTLISRRYHGHPHPGVEASKYQECMSHQRPRLTP